MSHLAVPPLLHIKHFLAAKKAIINLKYEDDECFKWDVTRALNPVET